MIDPDPFSAYLDSFGAGVGYLDFARVGPLSRQVIAARAEAADRLLDPTAQVIDRLMSAGPESLAAAAEIGGWAPSQLVYSPNTSTGLFQVAFALSGRGRRDQVLVSADEFPSNTYPWARAAAAGRLEPVWLPGRGKMTPDLIASALTDRTAAVSVSAVDFRSGHRADLSAIRSVIGDRWLIVDGIQGFGALPMDWTAADAVVVGGQKWLRSGWGTGFIAVTDRLAQQWEPLIAGWTGASEPGRYDGMLHPMVAGAPALSMTNHSSIDQTAFLAGLSLVQSVGVHWIGDRISGTAAAVAEALRSGGASVIGDPGGTSGSGIVPFALPGHDPADVYRRLRAAGVSCTLHGDRVRLSVHATTTSESIDMVLDALQGLKTSNGSCSP